MKIQLATKTTTKNQNKLKEKFNRGQVLHTIGPISNIAEFDDVVIECGESRIERTIITKLPFVAFMSRPLGWVTLLNFEPLVGMELYRLALEAGQIPRLFNEMLDRETRGGTAAMFGELLVWNNINSAYPYTPYNTKPASRTVSSVLKNASRLLWEIEASKNGRGLLSPVLAYEYLKICEKEGIELNFTQSVPGLKETTFCLPVTNHKTKGLTLAKKHADYFGIEDESFLSDFKKNEKPKKRSIWF